LVIRIFRINMRFNHMSPGLEFDTFGGVDVPLRRSVFDSINYSTI
jgi:hypothetical protein